MIFTIKLKNECPKKRYNQLLEFLDYFKKKLFN